MPLLSTHEIDSIRADSFHLGYWTGFCVGASVMGVGVIVGAIAFVWWGVS